MSGTNSICWVDYTESAAYQDLYNYQASGGWRQQEPIESGTTQAAGKRQVWVQGADPVCLAYVAALWATYYAQKALGMDPDEPFECPDQHMIEEPAVGTRTWVEEPTTYGAQTLTTPAPIPDSFGVLIQANSGTPEYGDNCPAGTSASCTFTGCPPPGGFSESDYVSGNSSTMQIISSESQTVAARRVYTTAALVNGEPSAFIPDDPQAWNSQYGYSVNMLFDYTQDETVYTLTASCYEEQDCYCS